MQKKIQHTKMASAAPTNYRRRRADYQKSAHKLTAAARPAQGSNYSSLHAEILRRVWSVLCSLYILILD